MSKPVPIFITSLADKRSRFQAELEHHERQAARCRDAIEKINATLALFEEGKWVRSKRRAYRSDTEWFKWKELPRLIVLHLRDSSEPLSTGDIQARLMASKGIAPASGEETLLQARYRGAERQAATGSNRV
jgi:hypothetical protein